MLHLANALLNVRGEGYAICDMQDSMEVHTLKAV